MLDKQEKKDLQILDDIISTARKRGSGEFGKKVQELIRESLIIKKEDIPELLIQYANILRNNE